MEVGCVQRSLEIKLAIGKATNLCTPSIGRNAIRRNSTSVFALYFGSKQGSVERNVRRKVDVQTTFLTFLCRNHNNTVSSHRAIKSGSVGTFKYVDAFNVIGVNQRKRVGAFGHACISKAFAAHTSAPACVVAHRNAVYHDKRRAITQNRLVTTQNNLRCATRTTCTRGDGDTRNLTFKRVGHVGVLHFHQVFCLHLLRGVG